MQRVPAPGLEPVADAPRRRADGRIALSFLVLAGYLVVARAATNLYPFSTFPMYSRTGDTGASRLFARVDGGSLHDISDLVDWNCQGPIDWTPPACAGRGIGYLERGFAEHIASHRGGGSEDVEIVRREFEFAADGSLRTRDCRVALCRATRP